MVDLPDYTEVELPNYTESQEVVFGEICGERVAVCRFCGELDNGDAYTLGALVRELEIIYHKLFPETGDPDNDTQRSLDAITAITLIIKRAFEEL